SLRAPHGMSLRAHHCLSLRAVFAKQSRLCHCERSSRSSLDCVTASGLREAVSAVSLRAVFAKQSRSRFEAVSRIASSPRALLAMARLGVSLRAHHCLSLRGVFAKPDDLRS